MKACIYIICCLGLLLACGPEAPDTEHLFRKNFLPYPNVLVQLNQDSTSSDPRYSFFLAYRDRDFAGALHIADSLSTLSPNDPLQLYRSVCLITLDKYKDAIPLLSALARDKGEFQDAARWYLSLIYLKQGQVEACKEQLLTLQNTSTYIRNEAKVLISKLGD